MRHSLSQESILRHRCQGSRQQTHFLCPEHFAATHVPHAGHDLPAREDSLNLLLDKWTRYDVNILWVTSTPGLWSNFQKSDLLYQCPGSRVECLSERQNVSRCLFSDLCTNNRMLPMTTRSQQTTHHLATYRSTTTTKFDVRQVNPNTLAQLGLLLPMTHGTTLLHPPSKLRSTSMKQF